MSQSKIKFKAIDPTQRAGFKHFIKENGKFVPFIGVTGLLASNYSIKIYEKLDRNNNNNNNKNN